MAVSGGVNNPISWEARYLAKDTPWDKGVAAPPLEEFLEKNTVTGRVFVPGCGTGQDVRALSRTGTDVTGLDFAPQAVATATRIPRVGNETYEVGDLFNLSPENRGVYDWV
ncbi:MAG: methyltransferase domain-containing protein, partial [Chthoniobacterales bacterium]